MIWRGERADANSSGVTRLGRFPVLLAAGLVAAFAGTGAVVLAGQTDPATEAEAPHALTIAVDPRIELLTAVAVLGGYKHLSKVDVPYRYDMEAYFAPWKDHEAVKVFAEMSTPPGDFVYDAPVRVMLHLSNPPELAVAVPFTDYDEKRAGGRERLDRFVKALRGFAVETEFAAFYDAHKGTYEKMAARVRTTMGGVDYIKALEDYYGGRQNSYTLIPAALSSGGYSSEIAHGDGALDLYAVIGSGGTPERGIAAFGDAKTLRMLVWHEFGHSFVNRIVEGHYGELQNYSALFDPIREKMTKQAYGDWAISADEHIVRAVVARLTHREVGPEEAAAVVKAEVGKGFIYVPALCRRLEEYEKNRDKYPTLESFYARLFDGFREPPETMAVPEKPGEPAGDEKLQEAR
jgi:hypothetical protein